MHSPCMEVQPVPSGQRPALLFAWILLGTSAQKHDEPKKAPEFFSCPMLFRGRPPRDYCGHLDHSPPLQQPGKKHQACSRGHHDPPKKEGMARRRIGLISGTGVEDERKEEEEGNSRATRFFFDVTTRASFLFCRQYQAMYHHAGG
jgi:hypothetical protein